MSNLSKTFSDLSADQRKLLEEKVPTLFNALKSAAAPPPPPAASAANPPPPPPAKASAEEVCIQVADYAGINNSKEVIDVFIITTYTIATDVLLAQKVAEHLRTKQKDDKKPLTVCLLSETQASVGLGLQMLEKAAVALLCISKKGLMLMAQQVEAGESRILLEIEHTLKSFAAGGKLLYSLMIDNDDNTPFGMFDTKIYPQIKHKSTKSLFAKENKTVPDTMSALFKLNGRPVSLELYQDRTPEILFKVKEADKKGIHRQIAKKLRLAKASSRPLGLPKVLTSGETTITIFDVAFGNVESVIDIGEPALNVLISEDAKYVRVATETSFKWVNLLTGKAEATVARQYEGEVHMLNTEVCYVLQDNAIVVASMVTGKAMGKLVLDPSSNEVMDKNVQPTEAALAGVIVMTTESKQFALWDILDNEGKVDLTGLKEAPKQEGDLPSFLPGQIIRQVKPLSPDEMAKAKQAKLDEEKAAKSKLAKGDEKKKEEKKGDKKKGKKTVSKKEEMVVIWKKHEEDKEAQQQALEITNLDISSDGRYLAYSTATTPYGTNPLYVIDLEGDVNNFCHILDSHRDQIVGINFSREGNFLLSVSSDATCKVWALETGEMEANLTPAPRLVHAGQDPQFSADEKFVLILDEVSGLQLWNVADKKMVQQFLPGKLHDFAMFNAYTEAKSEAAVGEVKHEVKTAEKRRASISSSPGADRMVIRAGDSYALVTVVKDGLSKVEIPYPRETLLLEICDPSTLQVYGVTTEGFLQASVLTEKGEVKERWKVNIAESSKRPEIGTISAIYLTPQYVFLLSDHNDHFVYSLGGRFLKFVRSDSPVQFFDTDDSGQYLAFAEDGPDGKGVLIRKIENTAMQSLCLTEDEYTVSAMSFFPDGSMLAVGCESGALLLLDSNAGTPVHTFPSRKSPTTISWSPSGKYLAVVYKDGESYPKVLIYSSAKRKTVNWGKKKAKPADGKEEQDDFIEIKSSRCGLGWSTDDTLLVWAAFGDSPYDHSDDGGDEKDYAISAVTVATGEIKEVLKCGSGARYLHRVLPPNRNLSSALDQLKIEQEQISVTTYDGIWKCKEHNSPYHDIFLNYRVWVNNKQNDLSMRLALHLGKQLKDNGSPVKVFLDRNCLVDGEDWEAGFLYGLAYSTTMVLLISDLVVQGIIDNAPKWQDNVMLEYEAALELYQKNEASVLPLYVDNEDFSPFSKKSPLLYPDAPHVSKLSGKNIRYTMTELFKIPGARISQGRFADRTSTIMDFLRTADAKGHHRIARSKPLFPRGPADTVPGTNVAIAREGSMKVDVFHVEAETCSLSLSFDSKVVHMIAPPAANQLFTLTENGRIAKHSLRTGLRQWDVFPEQAEGNTISEDSRVVLSPSCKRLCIFTSSKLLILEPDGTLVTTITALSELPFSGPPVFSYDDTFLVVPVLKSMQVWDLRKGVLLRSLVVRGLAVTSIALSFDNSNLACCSSQDEENSMVVVVSLTGKTLYEFTNDSSVSTVKISTVGSYLAAQGPNFVKVWSLDTGDLEGTFESPKGLIKGFLFTPDERHILVQLTNTVYEFNFTKGKIECALRSPCLNTLTGALAVCTIHMPKRSGSLEVQAGPLAAAPSPQEYGYFNTEDRKYYYWNLKTPEKPEAKPIRLPKSYSGDGDYNKLLAFKTHNGANCLYIFGEDNDSHDNLFAFKNGRQDFACAVDAGMVNFGVLNMSLEMDNSLLVVTCIDSSLICINASDGKFVKRVMPLDREMEEGDGESADENFSMAAGVPGSFAASVGGLIAFARPKGVILRGLNNDKEVVIPLFDPQEANASAAERFDEAGHAMKLTPWAYGDGNGYEAGWNCDRCARSNGDMEGNEASARYHCPECHSDICLTCSREGITCPNGHALTTGWSDDGWACDGRRHPDGCLKGCTGFSQSWGWVRFRCDECDFNLCDKCYNSFEADQETLEAAFAVAVSPQGDRVAAIPQTGMTLFLIDPVTHAVTATQPAPDSADGFTGSIAISYDGKYVAAQRGSVLCVWSVPDGKLVNTITTDGIFDDIPLRWSSDSAQLYVVSNDGTQTLLAYNALTGQKGVTCASFKYEDTETYEEEPEEEEDDGEDAEDDGVDAGVLCDNSHKLVMGANQDNYQGAASCDNCKASILPKFAFSCAECSYDLCKKCFEEKFDGTIQDAKGHIYILGANATKREYASGACCDECQSSIAASEAYSCAACCADLCASCYSKKEHPDEGEDGGDGEAAEEAEGGDGEAAEGGEEAAEEPEEAEEAAEEAEAVEEAEDGEEAE